MLAHWTSRITIGSGDATRNSISQYMKPGLVLDKCFLQGVSKEVMAPLSERYQLIVTGPLFYELLTCEPRARISCFAKFPLQTNPVILVDHIGTLMRRELGTLSPAGKPSTNRLKFDFQFNPKLLDSEYRMPLEAERALSHQSLELNSDIYELIELSKTAENMYGPLLRGTQEAQSQARVAAEKLIADCSKVVEFYGELEPPHPSVRYPPKHLVGPDWAVIRWLQAKMLFSLDLHIRYRGRVDEMLTGNVLEKLEHDLHDMQHFALAMLEGAFATNEKKLQQWWRLLMPGKDLISTTDLAGGQGTK